MDSFLGRVDTLLDVAASGARRVGESFLGRLGEELEKPTIGEMMFSNPTTASAADVLLGGGLGAVRKGVSKVALERLLMKSGEGTATGAKYSDEAIPFLQKASNKKSVWYELDDAGKTLPKGFRDFLMDETNAGRGSRFYTKKVYESDDLTRQAQELMRKGQSGMEVLSKRDVISDDIPVDWLSDMLSRWGGK